MNKQLDVLFSVLVRALTVLAVMVLTFVIYLIVKEALPTFDEVAVPDFPLGQRWIPITYTGEPSFGIFNLIAATFHVSLVAMVLAVTVGLGAAIYLSHAATERMRGVLYPFVDLLAGVPSMIYNFMGLTSTVKLFIRVGIHTGSYILAAGILLAVIPLPSLISSCSETMLKVRERYQPAADALGISKWHMAATIVLPGSWKNILLSMILAIGRAMGETMTVMMVIGNINLFPSLPGKGEGIASVIALKMGTAVVGSTHYHALRATGLVLTLLLFLINSGITLLHGRLEQQAGTGGRSMYKGGKAMHLHTSLTRFWAYSNIILVTGIILFPFGYVFCRGAGTIGQEFLPQSPRGTVPGEEGGIWPAIMGSLCFMATAIVLGGVPAVATALFMVFYYRRHRTKGLIRMVIQCISGLPSIVLGLFAYSFLVRDLAWGRCILSSGVALAVMILPLVKVRAEKTFGGLPKQLVQSSYTLGCTRSYTIWEIAPPACKGEIVPGMILGGCYAIGATAPLIFTGAMAYSSLPARLTVPAMALPMHLYLLVAQGATSTDATYGTTFVIMALILISNLLATIYARRSQREWNIS